jgi:hypothetical protein
MHTTPISVVGPGWAVGGTHGERDAQVHGVFHGVADVGLERRDLCRGGLEDQFVVDLGPGPTDVAEGDEAILFGPGEVGEPTAQNWADLLGTIHYEVVTSPRGRVLRSFTGRGVDGR